MAIQLYNLEGQPMEVIPDGSPIPGGRWTTPNGGYNWSHGINTPTTQTTPPVQQPPPTSGTTANNGSVTPPQPGWEYVGVGSGGRQIFRVPDTDPAKGQGNFKQFEYDPNSGQVDWSTLKDVAGSQYIPNPAGGFTIAPAAGQTSVTPPPQSTGGTQTGGTQTGTTNGTNTGFTGLTNPTPPTTTPATTTPVNTSYTPATSTGTTGGNYNQNQTASQGGAFSTTGATNTTQAQTSGSNTSSASTGVNNTQQTVNQNVLQNQAITGGNTQNTTTAGTSTNTGTTNEAQTGQQQTTGVSATKPIDTLGFGSLLQGAVGSTQANDTIRNQFLTDMVQNGGSALQSQTEQAVRNSLTGPQMTGAGDSARARAAGYAGAQIARQNTDQRLNAAQQLAGPSGLQTLVAAGNPYLGSATATGSSTNTANNTTGTSTNTGSTTGTSNTTGTNFQNLVGSTGTTGTTNTNQQTATNNTGTQTGFQNLVGSQTEASAGTASGQSSQAASGQIPQAQQVSTGGGGGCVICTVGIHHGLWRWKRVLRTVVKHKLQHDWPRFRHAARGYFYLFTPIAKWLLKHKRLAGLCMPIAKAVVYEELRIAGKDLPFRIFPAVAHWTWHFGCHIFGRLPIPDAITDREFVEVAKRHDVFFKIGGTK